MGRRSNRLKYRKRRQRAGFVLFVSVLIVVFGGVMFFSMDPAGRGTDTTPVSRIEGPAIAEAPEAVAEKAAEESKKAAEGSEKADNKQAEKEKAQKKESAEVPVPASKDLWLTVPKLGLYDVYVANSSDPYALEVGLAKLVETAFPWEEGANTYIAGHRIGWPGTGSDHIFYNLPLLAKGDKVYLTDANGTTYTYEVTEFLEVLPNEGWVTTAVAGRDIVSLQTCIETYGDYWTEGPNWYVRYIVRADKVSVDPA